MHYKKKKNNIKNVNRKGVSRKQHHTHGRSPKRRYIKPKSNAGKSVLNDLGEENVDSRRLNDYKYQKYFRELEGACKAHNWDRVLLNLYRINLTQLRTHPPIKDAGAEISTDNVALLINILRDANTFNHSNHHHSICDAVISILYYVTDCSKSLPHLLIDLDVAHLIARFFMQCSAACHSIWLLTAIAEKLKSSDRSSLASSIADAVSRVMTSFDMPRVSRVGACRLGNCLCSGSFPVCLPLNIAQPIILGACQCIKRGLVEDCYITQSCLHLLGHYCQEISIDALDEILRTRILKFVCNITLSLIESDFEILMSTLYLFLGILRAGSRSHVDELISSGGFVILERTISLLNRKPSSMSDKIFDKICYKVVWCLQFLARTYLDYKEMILNSEPCIEGMLAIFKEKQTSCHSSDDALLRQGRLFFYSITSVAYDDMCCLKWMKYPFTQAILSLVQYQRSNIEQYSYVLGYLYGISLRISIRGVLRNRESVFKDFLDDPFGTFFAYDPGQYRQVKALWIHLAAGVPLMTRGDQEVVIKHIHHEDERLHENTQLHLKAFEVILLLLAEVHRIKDKQTSLSCNRVWLHGDCLKLVWQHICF